MKNVKISNYYNGIKQYKEQLEKRIRFLEKKQSAYSNAHLKYQIKGNTIFYYLREKGKNAHPVYIRQKEKNKIDELANSWYVQRVLPKLRKNLRAANKFLELHSKVEEADIVNNMPLQLQEKNSALFMSTELRIKRWLAQPYTRNPYKPEGLIHETARGDMMRSKSEVLIADELYEHALAYKPEPPLRLEKSGRTIYPDFLILHPGTFKEILWEHFGMMDDSDYAREAFAKINALAREGYFMGDNLICTFERSDMPLTRGTIELYIEKYLKIM